MIYSKLYLNFFVKLTGIICSVFELELYFFIIIKFSLWFKFNHSKFFSPKMAACISLPPMYSSIRFLYNFNLFKFFFKLFSLQIKTSTLDPSLIGLITTGKFNFFLILFFLILIFENYFLQIKIWCKNTIFNK